MKHPTFAERLSLPPEVLSGEPLVTLRRAAVLIENHTGVSEYTPERICARVKAGKVSVLGSELRIARMTKRQLEVRGTIFCVQWE